MRKLKNVELVGKTRLIPGVGHVVMSAEMHKYVAEACDAAGLDWFEDGEVVTGGLVTGELVTGAADAADADENASEDAEDASHGTPPAPLSNQAEDAGKTQSTANGQNDRKRK